MHIYIFITIFVYIAMGKLDELKKNLKRGHVYRRDELRQWSNAIDRHLSILVHDGTLQKLSQGVYYYPKETVFGKTPPEDDTLVRKFLKDDRFLLTSPNAYNNLGVGTTQLYNKRTVYNHKRHGEFMLGNRKFDFQLKPHFPVKATPEFLLVDLVNNLDKLAEDEQAILTNILNKAQQMNQKKLKHAVNSYGNVRAKKFFKPVF